MSRQKMDHHTITLWNLKCSQKTQATKKQANLKHTKRTAHTQNTEEITKQRHTVAKKKEAENTLNNHNKNKNNKTETETETKTKTKEKKKMVKVANIVCDYLVIGSGAASLSFIDTLLTECPTSKIILADKRNAPGGHWVDAYGYVRLHQPSMFYGVSSKQLEGDWLKLLATQFMLPWKHRASKKEILTYYQKFVDEKIAAGQLQYFPGHQYDFEK